MTRALALLAVLAACSSHAGSMATDAGAPGDAGTGDGPPVDADTTGRWLHVSSLGVAFSQFPGRSVLTRTLAVHSAHGPPEVAWTAAADQAWLAVTASGMTGGSLVLTADPTHLAPDHQYTATVRVRSSDPLIRNEQDVRVGLWIGSADPPPVKLSTFVSNLVADPVLPRLYTSTSGTDITVYDVYTGAVTVTFGAVVGRAGTMAISSDGAMLFVNDTATRQIVALDTTTGSVLRRYPWASITSSGLGYARPNAHPVLLAGNSKVFDVDTGMFHRTGRITAGFNEDASFAADPDDGFVYAQDHGSEPSNLRQYAIDYDLRHADPLVAMDLHDMLTGVFGQTLCVAADGSRVYAANGSSSTPAFSAATLTQIQQLPGGGANAACGWNGLFFGGDGANVTAYRLDGTSLGTFSLPAQAGTLVLSGDNTRLAGSLNPFQGTPSFSILGTPSP